MERYQDSPSDQKHDNSVKPHTQSDHIRPDRLRSSLISQSASQFLKLLVAIGIGGWTARFLGPQSLGTLGYVAALVGLLGPLGNLGVKGSLSAMLCDEQPLPGLLGSALFIELSGTLVVALVLLPYVWLSWDPVLACLVGLAVVGNLLDSSEVFEVELLNRQHGTRLARISTIQIFFGASFSIFALLTQMPLLAFGALPVLQASVRAWLLAKSVQATKLIALLRQASWETSVALVKRGWPLLLSSFSVVLYMKSDQVMLEWLRGPFEVGQYSVAVRVAESLYFLPVILASTFIPRIGKGSGNFETDPELRKLYRIAWLLGIGMVLTSILVLPPIVQLVFGNDFLPAKEALIWLGPAAFSVATGCASSAWLNVQGYQRFSAQRTALGALVNLVLNMFLIPYIGFVGAAIATSISQFVSVYAIAFLKPCISSNLRYSVFPFL